jgi:hypothetical protein
MLIDIIADFGFANNHIYQQRQIIGLQTVRKFHKLLHVSAPSSGSLQYKGAQAPVHLEKQCEILRHLKC